ncbi:hypothetical protein G5V65_18230 [Rhodobacter sp. HX-7-19]|uniref:Uncharacterized protein n=1 Tax=Paragemmobacter kunshanensis TaxID=2583234 RepID=A0A6M1UAH5_9RHOB|nr:hypothetical protein [Rhodobacter kunshanensis]NGQ92833.1 hypothetical protein [Rhodobacter kunshanensis]
MVINERQQWAGSDGQSPTRTSVPAALPQVRFEPITEEPILRCARTQRNVCFGAANIHAASQLWILSFVRNVENFSEAVAAQRTKLSFPMSVMLAS